MTTLARQRPGSTSAIHPLTEYLAKFWGADRELERARGIEPPSKAWEAFVLPLNYARSYLALSLQAKGGGLQASARDDPDSIGPLRRRPVYTETGRRFRRDL